MEIHLHLRIPDAGQSNYQITSILKGIIMTTTTYQYKLVAQNKSGLLIIEIIEKSLFIIKNAREILKDTRFLKGFPPEHAAIIGVIAGME